jgi:hypothetical protein
MICAGSTNEQSLAGEICAEAVSHDDPIVEVGIGGFEWRKLDVEREIIVPKVYLVLNLIGIQWYSVTYAGW